MQSGRNIDDRQNFWSAMLHGNKVMLSNHKHAHRFITMETKEDIRYLYLEKRGTCCEQLNAKT